MWKNNINDIQAVKNLSDEVPFFEKALMCYESDIDKAQNTGHEYFVNLVGDLAAAKNDVEIIKIALKKIKNTQNNSTVLVNTNPSKGLMPCIVSFFQIRPQHLQFFEFFHQDILMSNCS